MECDEVKSALVEGSALSPELEDHVDACPGCAELVADDAALAMMLATGEDVPPLEVADLRSELARERGLLGRMRSLSTPSRVGIVVSATIAMAVGTVLFAPRSDLATYPPLNLLVHVLALVAFAAAYALMGFWPLHKQALSTWQKTLGVIGAVLVSAGMAAAPFFFGPRPGEFDHNVSRAMVCLISGAVTGSPLLFLGWMLERNGQSGGFRAAAGALSAAGVGMTFLILHCSVDALDHHILGHLTVPLLLVLLYPLARGAWKKVRK